MTRLEEHYRKKVVPELMKKFGYTNPMQVPRITKITLNMGVGEAMADKKDAAKKKKQPAKPKRKRKKPK